MQANIKIDLKRTDSSDRDFIDLVTLLDLDLAKSDGEDHEFYHQYNQIDNLKYVVVAYHMDKPIGCGAIKGFDPITMEVKRMYTLPENRGMGVASALLNALEQWTKELTCEKCVLETGLKQIAALALYPKMGYVRIPNYGQYKGIENSVCFLKSLK